MAVLFNNRGPEDSEHVDGNTKLKKEISCLENISKMAGMTKNKIAIFSYEHHQIDAFDKHFVTDVEMVENYLGKIKLHKDILIMRDAFNAVASRLMMNRANKRPDEDIFDYVDKYKDYAREYLGETNYLQKKHTINFNRWVCSTEYRKEIADSLGLVYTDKAKNAVSKIGGGSSWNKTDFNKRAYRMQLDSRWKKFIKDPFYHKIFKDEELIDLSSKIHRVKGAKEILKNAK